MKSNLMQVLREGHWGDAVLLGSRLQAGEVVDLLAGGGRTRVCGGGDPDAG